MLVVHTYISQAISIASLKMSEAASPAKPKVQKSKKKSVPAAHPTYIEMIKAAVTALKEKKGSSRPAIKKYIEANYKVGDRAQKQINFALRKGVAGCSLKQIKGCYKLGDKLKTVSKKPKGPKKSSAKKTAQKKKAPKKKSAKKPKKPVAKKPAPKKAAPKKKAPPKKKAAAKPAAKPAAKSAAKPAAKPAAKKAKK